MLTKRKLNMVVISDVHLGTYGCRAKELLNYLRSIETECLILNGDFIDIWQFRKKYFPKEHMQVLHKVLKMAENGTKVYYITGNHDDRLRRYADLTTGNLFLRNQLTISLNHKKYLIFHGDVFDLSVQYSPFIAKLGGRGYDYLILLNRLVNNIRIKLGKQEMSLAGRIKDSVKKAVKFVGDFENKAIELATEKNYDYVICGHIHCPQMRAVDKNGKQIIYLNSGDWIENLTALEYKWGQWSIYRYDSNDFAETHPPENEEYPLKGKHNVSLLEQMVQLAAEV
ncbi:MAG: UDP-2,3-diacylglucosamine diphosphatase [Bacteroidota bacterium]